MVSNGNWDIDSLSRNTRFSYFSLPTLEFPFPKQPFGKAKVVYRSFQKSWFKEWPFLHYDEVKDVAFCHTCATAVEEKKIRASTAEASFVSD